MKSKVLALILLCGAASLGAKVKLPALVGDNMILQQQTEVTLWGTAAPEAEVRVTPAWNGQTMTCRADKDGGWTLAVETPAAGYTPYAVSYTHLACRYAEFLFDGCLRLRTEVEPQCGNDNDTDNYRAGTVSDVYKRQLKDKNEAQRFLQYHFTKILKLTTLPCFDGKFNDKE